MRQIFIFLTLPIPSEHPEWSRSPAKHWEHNDEDNTIFDFEVFAATHPDRKM